MESSIGNKVTLIRLYLISICVLYTMKKDEYIHGVDPVSNVRPLGDGDQPMDRDSDNSSLSTPTTCSGSMHAYMCACVCVCFVSLVWV